MTARGVAAMLAGLVLLAACGRSAHLDPLAPDAVVLAFGDSLTLGNGARPDEAYPAVLAREIGRKVVNAGVSGETSAQGLERLPAALEEAHPALLILCHGGNDFLQKQDEARTARHVRAMVKLALAQGVQVLLVATPRPGLPPSVPPFYGQIAKEMRVPLEDESVRAVELDNGLKSDFVHPNAQGYARIAGAVRDALAKAGALAK